jgi:hypothetical protein
MLLHRNRAMVIAMAVVNMVQAVDQVIDMVAKGHERILDCLELVY